MYHIEWDFESKHRGKMKRYWAGFGAGYSTNQKAAKIFPTLKSAEVEAGAIMESRGIGASPRRCRQ